MYYSAIGLLAVLILLIVNQDILFKPQDSYERPAWNVYRRFLFAVGAYYITDVLWGVLDALKQPALLFADTTVYFAAMAIGVGFWAEFTVAYLDEDRPFGRFLVYAGRIVAGGIALLSVVNVFVPVLFTVDAACVYTALPTRYVMLVCQIALLLLISTFALSSMIRAGDGDDARDKRRRYWILAAFGLIMVAFLFAQLWLPRMPLYSIAYMLGTCMLHTFVANDEREEHRESLKEAAKVTELSNTITSLLDNMPGMTFTKDAESGVYLACNQAFAEYAHKDSPAGVVGLTDAQIFDAQTATHFVQDDRMALSISTPYVFYEDVPDAAGTRRQFQTTKIKYRDMAGRLCVLGMCQDVTDMVRIQHENAMTKEAYESAVSSSLMYTHIAQTLARDYTDMFYVNCDTEEFIEYRRGGEGADLSEMRRGWHFFSDCKAELAEQVLPADREAFLSAMNRKTLMKALSRNDTFVMTYRLTGEGSPVYVTCKVSRMEHDEHFIIIGITDVDAEMREAMAKSEALASALAAAEQASKAKTSFLSNLSHEIRTPMNAIIGLDSLAMKHAGLDDETRGYLEKIGGSARHLLALINDILDMSRIESGRVVLRKEPFSFTAMLEQINTLVASQCAEKGLVFECDVSSALDELYIGDDMKLKEVLVNILSNAIKFTEAPGRVTLSVERVVRREDTSTLRFCVEDTGIGMDEEFLPKLYDPFAQADSGQTNKFGSTGMGMAITKGLVELMNGTIDVVSEVGVGTTFDVKVTLGNCDSEKSPLAEVVDLSALYVLVVDDNPIDAEHARTVLEEVGIRADTAGGGEEALRMMEVQHAKHTPYNLVLMDWNMPGMNGMEASREILKQFKDECTVVMLTAYNSDDIQEEARNIGVNSLLTKPLFAERVVDDLDRIARRSNMPLSRERKRASLAGRRVLLAEDVAINADIMMAILEMESIEADHATNGRIAVDMFAASAPGTYTAVLMDVRMPEMGGLEAASAIRALNRADAASVPIVALTANAFDEDVQRSLQAGMNAHLSKPVDPDDLIRILGELVFEAESRRS